MVLAVVVVVVVVDSVLVEVSVPVAGTSLVETSKSNVVGSALVVVVIVVVVFVMAVASGIPMDSSTQVASRGFKTNPFVHFSQRPVNFLQLAQRPCLAQQ